MTKKLLLQDNMYFRQRLNSLEIKINSKMTKNPLNSYPLLQPGFPQSAFIYFPTNTSIQCYVIAMKFNNSDHQKKATNNQDNLNLKYRKNYYFPS